MAQYKVKILQIDVRVISLFYGMTQLFRCSMDISDVCPLTSFCADRQNGVNISHQFNSCCFPCSCHRNCKLVGTCCHDAEQDDHLHYMYPCANQAEIYSQYLGLRYASSPALHGRVITDCHNDEKHISNETIFRCRNPLHLEDLVFATGKSSGITYINKHCALCNGEDDVDVWNIYMMSRDAEALFSINATFEARDEFLLRTGSVVSIPSTDFAAVSTFCHKPTFGSCNISGQWKIYNKDIMDKCSFYNSVYYETGSGRFYKNPFCYICNSPSNDRIIDKKCEILADELYSMLRTPPVDLIFTTLFLPTLTTSESQAEPRPGCRFKKTVDLFTKACTELLCPPGTVVVDGQCMPMFPNDSGITIVVSFYVDLEEPIAINQLRNGQLLKELRQSLVSEVKNFDRKCDYCVSLFSTLDDDLVFSISFKSSRICGYLQYLKIISMIYKKTPIRVFSVDIQRNVSLKRGQFPNDITRTGFVVETRKNAGVCTAKVQFNENIIPCPSILISLSDIDGLSLSKQVRDEVLDLGTYIGNGTLRVCVEEYNKIYARSSGIVASYVMSILITLDILYFTLI